MFLGVLRARFAPDEAPLRWGPLQLFQTALRRQAEDPDALSVYVYAKEEPIPREEIDPREFQRLRDVKGAVEHGPARAATYEDRDELGSAVRRHLAEELKAHVEAPTASHRCSPGGVHRTPEKAGTDEFENAWQAESFEHRVEKGHEALGETARRLDELVDRQVAFSGSMETHRADLERLAEDPEHEAETKAAGIVEEAAEDLQAYAQDISGTIGSVVDAFEEALEAYGEATRLSKQNADASSLDELKQVHTRLLDVQSNVREYRQRVRENRRAIQQLEVASETFERARDELVETLGSVEGQAGSMAEAAGAARAEIEKTIVAA